jgi:hypothetical protein
MFQEKLKNCEKIIINFEIFKKFKGIQVWSPKPDHEPHQVGSKVTLMNSWVYELSIDTK